MGWIDRDSDVKYVRDQHASVERKMMGLASAKGYAKANQIPEVMDSYVELCHMVGVRPDDRLIDQAFKKLRSYSPTVQLMYR